MESQSPQRIRTCLGGGAGRELGFRTGGWREDPADEERDALRGGAKVGQFLSEQRFLARHGRLIAPKNQEKEWPIKGAKTAVRPAGLEPATLSSED